MKQLLLSLGCVLFMQLGFSQREASKTLDFKNNVEDLLVVPFNGITVISDGTKVSGYDPEQEKIIWEKDAPQRTGVDQAANFLQSGPFRMDYTKFNAIESTPFVEKFFDGRLYVLNSYDGKVLFSAEGKAKYFQAEYLFDENSFLLRGVNGMELIIAKYNIPEQKFDWQTTVSATYGETLQKLSKLAGMNNIGIKDKMDHTDDKVFALIKEEFFVLNKETGDLLWKEDEGDVMDFKRSLDGSKVITIKGKGLLSNKNEIMLFDANTGNSIWDKSLTTKNIVLFEDWQDKMLLAHYKGFNFYDYNTGEKVWKKDPKGKGIKSVIPIGTDFLYVYDDEMMLLNKKGEKMWKKDVKICDDEEDPIYFLEKTKNGRVLYITATYANMVDYKTGEKIWRKNLKLNEKRPTFAKYDENSGNFVVYNDEELYKFNEGQAERPEPYAEMKLKDEKDLTSLEIFENNVTITGLSEVVGVDNSGKIIFHNKYKQPGETGRLLKNVGLSVANFGFAVATATVTTETTYRDPQGNEVRSGSSAALFGENAKAIGEAGYLATDVAMAFAQDRFNALQETNKYALIFAKGENGERLLVKVDKETGEELDKVIINDLKPVYDVDHVSDDIYYSTDNHVKIFKSK
ncbi:PQQ-binding-like beta-propeller repeat protein [Galbibacter sp. BG1]|uniref:outer membrane protein assembly factor BamB family protein n=1 Tax=Galbibacter sp. BG1 TaxID=1170699 RepID=UPI0015BA255F|nr:PQQ-binding-like beta-propeller repeat protein [Galbibacter sp. BG1]QLE01434.1 PQQ-binding-like beta-propeller repeat protein [Galbibacter sp. BG1]